jgi:PTS system mannose-specific IIA component
MSVGLLLITHNRIGDELLKTAIVTLNHCPLTTRALPVFHTHDPDSLLTQAQVLVNEINSGGGVLVLTDIYGSTPSNIAIRLLESNPVIVIAGVSLPMLIRVLNYATLSLPELAHKAVSGGCEGIVLSTQNNRGKVGC